MNGPGAIRLGVKVCQGMLFQGNYVYQIIEDR